MAYLTTRRLILRRFEERDFYDFFQYVSNADVLKYEPYQPMDAANALNELRCRISDKRFIAVELAEKKKLIGNLYVTLNKYNGAEIGFIFNDKYWHQGYAKEATQALIDYCFSKGIHRVYGSCDCDNENSWRLFEALGFKREARLKENIYFRKNELNKPIYKDSYVYAKLNDR